MLPKRRFWKAEQKIRSVDSMHFARCEYWIWATNHWKTPQKCAFHLCFSFQNLRLGSINFARWLQRIVATCDAMCRFFTKPNAWDDSDALLVIVRWTVCVKGRAKLTIDHKCNHLVTFWINAVYKWSHEAMNKKRSSCLLWLGGSRPSTHITIVANKKVALSALGENLLGKVVKK